MTRDQLLATITILTLLAGAIAAFYDLKGDVRVQNEQIQELGRRFDYMHGANWSVPEGAK